MYISQGTYAAYFLWSLFGGALLGVLYDVFRIIRIASARESGGGLPEGVRDGLLKKRAGREAGPAESAPLEASVPDGGAENAARDRKKAARHAEKASMRRGGEVERCAPEYSPDAAGAARTEIKAESDGECGTGAGRRAAPKGASFAALYDRLFWLSVFLEDLLFFLTAACVMALITYQLNYGRFRWFALAAACGGFAAYYFTVGRLVMLVSGTLLLFLRRAAELLWRVTVVPVRKGLVWCFGGIWRMLNRQAAVRRTVRTEKRMLREAKDGFREQNGRGIRRL